MNEQQELHEDSDEDLTVEDWNEIMGVNRDIYKIVKGRVKRAEVYEVQD